MGESLGTFMSSVHDMGQAARDVMICLSIALFCLLVIISYIGYIIIKVRRAWK